MEKMGIEVQKQPFRQSLVRQQPLEAGLKEILLKHSQLRVPMFESLVHIGIPHAPQIGGTEVATHDCNATVTLL